MCPRCLSAFLRSCCYWPRRFCVGGKSARLQKSRPRLRLVWLIFAVTLALSGCASLTARQTQTATLPVRPELTSLTVTSDGGIMMDKRDAAELLIYLEQLERMVGAND